ncbi:hypothetical protein EW146_g3019 [Bondarzewia mesenterica]|uniref:Uncharacterized protein n=1 Tax=Bondarzewia mesenterica TaxID=1095465 RepID=A0A4S4LZ50_9AGAM|nr:hypothetical protein EW146_g3019 [Bondarzewia mesenterica]
MAESTAKYQTLPQSDENEETTSEQAIRDPRFDQPTPSAWKRAGILFLIAFLFWLAYWLRTPHYQPPKVVHATRYSKEFKYRPAASPIITERLKDGRMRLRGAQATGRSKHH